jgi:hypothetical protein
MDEILQRFRDVSVRDGAGQCDLVSNLFVARPTFRRIESDHADRAAVLVSEKILHNARAVGAVFVGFAPNAAYPAEVVQNQTTSSGADGRLMANAA